MARISVTLNIDVTKIDKAKLFKGAKGTYLDANVFIDLDNEDQYGNHGMITQQVSKEEREAKVAKVYLGNVKVVWTNGTNVATAPRDDQGGQQQQAQSVAPQADDLPF